jgi:hypothetical protein
MIRTLYPIDLLPLFFSSGRIPLNQAINCDSLSKRSPTSPEVILEHWLPMRMKRLTWVCLERGRILGLVSIRGCYGSAAWHVDYLQVDGERCLPLLDKAITTAAKQGISKLFLRLPSDSPLIDEARRCGFTFYKTAYLYRYNGKGEKRAPMASAQYRVRSIPRNVDNRLFDLYNATVPVHVRIAEGMTLKEWQETREQASWPGKHREFVLGEEDHLAAWLRVETTRGVGCFNIICHRLDDDGLEWLVNYALICLDGKSPIFCIAFPFQESVLRLLGRLGFEQIAECSTLVKEIAIKVKEPHLMPIQA